MKEIEAWFEKRGFTRIICNWADALFANDLGMNVEIVVVKNDEGAEFYRAFCAGKDVGVLMRYYHTFIKNEAELDIFLTTCEMQIDTQSGDGYRES